MGNTYTTQEATDEYTITKEVLIGTPEEVTMARANNRLFINATLLDHKTLDRYLLSMTGLRGKVMNINQLTVNFDEWSEVILCLDNKDDEVEKNMIKTVQAVTVLKHFYLLQIEEFVLDKNIDGETDVIVNYGKINSTSMHNAQERYEVRVPDEPYPIPLFSLAVGNIRGMKICKVTQNVELTRAMKDFSLEIVPGSDDPTGTSESITSMQEVLENPFFNTTIVGRQKIMNLWLVGNTRQDLQESEEEDEQSLNEEQSFQDYSSSSSSETLYSTSPIITFPWFKAITFVMMSTMAYQMSKYVDVSSLTQTIKDKVNIQFANAWQDKNARTDIVNEDNTTSNKVTSMMVTAVDKHNYFDTVQRASLAANIIASEERRKIKANITMVLTIINLITSHPAVSILNVLGAIAAYSMDKLDWSIISSVATSGLPMLTKISSLAVFVAYEYKLITNKNLIKYLLLPAITATTLSTSARINKNWDQLDAQIAREKPELDRISNYWAAKGMNSQSGTSCRLRFKDKSKQDLEKDAKRKEGGHLDVTCLLTPCKHDADLIGKYHHSKHDDEALVKAIIRRLAGVKKEARVQSLKEFSHILVEEFSKREAVKQDTRECIRKAMSTKGTAGEWAKHTTLERDWKDVNNTFMVDYWCGMIDSIRKDTIIRKSKLTAHDAYQIYQKVEILPYNADGSHKITRLIQAPLFSLRIADSGIFNVLNDSLMMTRKSRPAQIGINPFTELKHVLWISEEEYAMGWDMTLFDKHQHPMQMAACRDARILQLLYNKSGLFNAFYVAHRYDRQIWRLSAYKKYIYGYITGGQASGDTTTSDDNTMRNETFMHMAAIKLREYHITMIRSYAMGDDGLAVFMKGGSDQANQTFKIICETANGIGWETRDEHAYNGPTWAEFIAHTIKERLWYCNHLNNLWKIPMIYREGARPVAKFWLSGDQKGKMNKRGREIVTSKAYSFLISNISDPLMVIRALTTMVIARANIREKAEGQGYYTTQILKNTPLCLELEMIIEVHTEERLMLDGYIISEEEQKHCRLFIEWAKKEINKKFSVETTLFDHCLVDNKFNVRKAIIQAKIETIRLSKEGNEILWATLAKSAKGEKEISVIESKCSSCGDKLWDFENKKELMRSCGIDQCYSNIKKMARPNRTNYYQIVK